MLSESDVRLRRVSAGEVVYPPGGTLGPRRQADVQLVLVHTGVARIEVDGVERPALGPGWTGLLLPGHRERFAFAPDRPTRHSWVQVGVDAVPAAWAALPAALPTSPALGELAAQAAAAARAPSGPLLRALAAAALWRYAADAALGAHGGSDVVARARAYLHDHLADRAVDLPAVARAAHVSPAHLVRRFRAELGTTPMAYLWERRVGVGVDLLRSTGLSVGEIAARAGFRSVYHFSRRVRAREGVPPTGVRAARWAPANGNGAG